MVNPKRKGANFERRVKKLLESKGYYVIKSSGSEGVFDLVAISTNKTVYGIQCKYNGKLTRHEQSKILETSNKYGMIPILAYSCKRKIFFKHLGFDIDIEM